MIIRKKTLDNLLINTIIETAKKCGRNLSIRDINRLKLQMRDTVCKR